MTKQEKHLLEVTLQAERAMVPFMLSLGIRPRILSSQIPHQSVLVSVVLQKMHDCNKTYTIAIRTHDCNLFHTIATYVSAALNHQVNSHEAQSVGRKLLLRNGVTPFGTLFLLIITEAQLHPQGCELARSVSVHLHDCNTKCSIAMVRKNARLLCPLHDCYIRF